MHFHQCSVSEKRMTIWIYLKFDLGETVLNHLKPDFCFFKNFHGTQTLHSESRDLHELGRPSSRLVMINVNTKYLKRIQQEHFFVRIALIFRQKLKCQTFV